MAVKSDIEVAREAKMKPIGEVASKVDSRTIPGIVMADIWMRIREELADE